MIKNIISDEELAAYLDNNIDVAKTLHIDNLFESDSLISEVADVLNDLQFLGTELNTLSFGTDTLESYFTEHQIMDNTMNNIFESDGIVGNATNPIQQQYSDTCAIKSQQLILNDYGVDVNEDQLVQYSYEHGWYQGDGSGTNMGDVGNLLEQAGIPCTRQENANVFNLVSELSQGHKVIVGVDSGELWGNKFTSWWNDFYNGDTPDHALIVSGIDTTDPNNVKVIVTDPGTGEGYKEYPLEQFMDAWSDSQCYMVSTDVPVPQIVPGMENFDYSTGHIPNVAGMDYSDFQIFNDISCGLPVVAQNDLGVMDYPVSDLFGAFGAVNDGMSFNDIFSSFDFNNYLDTDVTTDMLQQTYADNIGNINFDDGIQPIEPMSNNEYSDFLNNSIDYFNSIGDFNSASLCEQQMMMLDYCDANDLNFYDSIIS